MDDYIIKDIKNYTTRPGQTAKRGFELIFSTIVLKTIYQNYSTMSREKLKYYENSLKLNIDIDILHKM